MTGLVIASHGNLAEELLRACEAIIGPLGAVRAVGVRREDSVDEIRGRLDLAIREVAAEGDGVLVMTDMFGGTPANLSLSFLEPDKVEIVTGVNLPMVLKFFNTSESLSLTEKASLVTSYGRQGISLASDFLRT